MRNPFKIKRREPTARESLMAKALAAALEDGQRRVDLARREALAAREVAQLLRETLGGGRKIKVATDPRAYAILGGGDEFDTFTLLKESDVENAENAWQRYLRRQARDLGPDNAAMQRPRGSIIG